MSEEIYKKALEVMRRESEELLSEERVQEERLKAVKLRRGQLRVLVENLAALLGEAKE